MKSLFKTIIVPEGDRYNNSDDRLILNANINIQDFTYTNRVGIVVETPHFNPQVQVGDRVLVHTNVFRRYWGFTTHLRTSSADLHDGTFGVDSDSIFAYDRGDGWVPLNDWLFVEPVEADTGHLTLSTDYLKTRIGKLRIGEVEGLKIGDTVAFTPFSEFEFRFDGMKLYKMRVRDITAKIK